MIREKVDANEHIRRSQAELGLGDGEKLPFLCECDDVHCRQLIQLTVAEYGSARATGDRCVVADGHPYRGRIVIDGEGYVVIDR